MISQQDIAAGRGGVEKAVLITGKDGYRAWVSLGHIDGTHTAAIVEAFDEEQYKACKALVERCQTLAMNINININNYISPIKQQAGQALLEKTLKELEGSAFSDDKKEGGNGSN